MLDEVDYGTGGPARYVRVEEIGARSASSPAGAFHMCLGREDAADLRAPLRLGDDDAPVDRAVHAAIARKPKGHDFVINRRHAPRAVSRHMSVAGG